MSSLTQPRATDSRNPAPAPEKAAFEAAFAAYCGSRQAIATNSGTTALDLAIDSLDLPEGGCVVAADYGHPSTVRRASERHELRLVDVDTATWCLSPAAVEEALAEGNSCCVITTHFAGQAAGIHRIVELCDRYAIPLVEDAAHAHGVMIGGCRVGSFGTLSCFSFHWTKPLPAGEGGVVVTDDVGLATRLWH